MLKKLLMERDLMEDEFRPIQEITDLIVTILYDDRIPFSIRKEYHQKVIDEKMNLIGFFSNDLAEILSENNKRRVQDEQISKCKK